jgi:PAS domain S-box-containing protein
VRQLKQHQVVDWLKRFCQQHWLPILLGIVATIAVLGISQQLQQAELLAGVQSFPLKVVRLGGLAGAWTLAFMVYLGQRSERYVRQAQKINQQLQAEINERRQIEIELRRSEASNHNLSDRLALAVQSAQIGIWDWDIINDCLIWNDQMHTLYGVTPSNFSGAYQAWASTLHPDDFDRTTTAIQQAIRGEGDYDPEFRVVHSDGSVRYIQAHAIVQRDPQGQARRMIGVNLDITNRKQTEIALQNSQARFAGILEIASDAIISVNSSQTITLFNQGAERIFGYRAEEILGQPLTILMPNRFAQSHPQSVQQYTKGEGSARQMSRRGVIFGRRKDGSEFPAEASISQLNLNGEITFTTFLRDITARQQAEVAMAHLAAIIESSEDAIISKSLTGIITSWNAGAEKIFGYTAAEIVGQPVTVLIPTNRTVEENHILQRICQGECIAPYDTQRRRKDGTLIDLSISTSPIKDTDGKIIGVSKIARDIRDRKRIEAERFSVEQALLKSEERLQLALEAAGDGLWDWDVQTGKVYLNAYYQKMLGYIPNELVMDGDVWEAMIHPDDKAWVLERLQNHFKDGSVQYSFDYRVRCKSGEWKWIADYGKVVARDSEGKPLRMLGTHKDISDRKQAETELKQQKEMLQTIVNHIPVMIALFTSEGRIEFVNPEFERVLGWSLEDWQQRDVLLECYPDPAYYQMVIEHMVAVNGKWKDFSTLTKSGQQIETSWTNVQLSNGRNLGIGQDISDRKQKEIALQQAMEAAEAANLAKSIFLANMSHELRTPLNVILGFTQVMAHDSSLTTNQKEDLETIRRSGDHLLSLINDVLDLSKIEAGHCILEGKGFDLISLLHTLRTMMTERAKVKHLQLTFDIAPEVPQFIISDEQKLRQILLNLLSNAIKFTNRGSITLRVTSQESNYKIYPAFSTPENGEPLQHSTVNPFQTLQFEVIDTGVGIDEKEQATIFDAFVQAEAGRKSVSGTGLGLTISRKLLDLMNGEMAVRSIPNLGSTFTFTIPICPTSGVNVPSAAQRRVVGLAPDQPQRRILVVDDQRENRLVLVRLLNQLGLEVREATNGQDAIQIWQDWQPDLTYMDIRMPGLDGYEATKQIRAMEHGQASIIIALTAQASQSDRDLALAAGCNDYISKPFQEETLFLKLKEYLGLEYLYAEPNSLPNSSSVPSSDEDASSSLLLDPAVFAQLSIDWLDALEDAAVCGNDRAIVELASQLPPEFTPLGSQLAQLAEKFQFEQIIQLMHHSSPS